MTTPAPDAPTTEENPTRNLSGPTAWIAGALAFTLAALALYWTQYSIGTTTYRAAFLGFVLVLAFLLYPTWEKAKHLTLAAASAKTAIPFHPAATVFYKARGAIK